MAFTDWLAEHLQISPHPWQSELGSDPSPRSRLIRIPTGMGKTIGVLAAWIYNRLIRQDPAWPRRLVWCLPMRVLTEQTATEAKRLLGELDLSERAGVHVLMGGEDSSNWRLYPEREAILIGTQDMLLSRALNRGYASGRARWPMEYALLNTDALWVLDEVQLMDVALITSVQMQAFRDQDRGKALRPTYSWWMSATLQPAWLETVDSAEMIQNAKQQIMRIPPAERDGALWDIEKEISCRDVPAKDAAAMGDLVQDLHRRQPDQGTGRITLAICNTVDRACELFQKLQKIETDADLKLIHSRFRGKEKEAWTNEFLAKKHCTAGANRIIVATQVVEAGVDISAGVLVTELAPWPSLVQRFGRCARYGGRGTIVVVDRGFTDKNCAPYEFDELQAAKAAVQKLQSAGVAALESFEEDASDDLLTQLYPYRFLHLITRRETDELFDTSPDLTGADIDVSRFIRSGDERDVSIFWADVPENEDPPPECQPLRRGLCSTPIDRIDSWLFNKGSLKPEHRAWYWDYIDSAWLPLRPHSAYPGLTLLVSLQTGGYDPVVGFTGKKEKKQFIDLDGTILLDNDLTDLAQAREDRSVQPWKTIAFHCREVERELAAILDAVPLDSEKAVRSLQTAARLHDWGKVHPAFSSSIRKDAEGHPDCVDLAKAPETAWVHWRKLYCQSSRHGERRGFRHELAGAIACLEYVRIRDPFHPALLGEVREWVATGVLPHSEAPTSTDDPLNLLPLSGEELNLMAYLVCAHHGKVRGAWQATPQDQEFPADSDSIGEGQPIRGVRDGDALPACRFLYEEQTLAVPQTDLHLDAAAMGLSNRYGRSWGERVSNLLAHFGPFTLAYLECLIRAADCRASQSRKTDPLLQGDPP